MNCVNCGNKMKVVEVKQRGNTTYRRYRCECGEYLYTKECKDPRTKKSLNKLRYEQIKEKKD